MFGPFIVNFVRFLAIALELLILARVLLSWVDPTGRGPIGSLVIQTTEPLLAPIRRVLPQTGMFDLSPMVALIVLTLILRWVV